MSLAGGEFLTFTDVVATPPLPALLSAFMTLGILWLARRAAAALGKHSPLHVAAAFVAVAGVIASVVHAMAWAGFLPLPVLKLLAWGLAVLGMAEMRHVTRVVPAAVRAWAAWARTDRPFALASLVAAVGGAGLVLSALGPATDADSLDYHLGVPLDWLRRGGAYPRTDWMHARVVGVGDMLNLLGLAGGTDGFGALIQVGGLVACVVAVSAFGRNARDRVLAALFVLACPVPLFLATSQKPQLLLVGATTVALALVVLEERLGSAEAVLVGASVGFAIASKYSFLLTAAAITPVFLAACSRSGRPWLLLGTAVTALTLLALPQLLRNAVMYGDPLTPMLERFRARPDPVVTAFAEHLRTYGQPGRGAIDRLRAAIAVVIPSGLGQLSTALGVGALGVLLARPVESRGRGLLLTAALAAGAIAAFGQLTGRFFLEPYLWAGSAVVVGAGEAWKNRMTWALAAQGMIVGAAALTGAAVLAPGALTAGLRNRVMEQVANGYSEAEWLDRIAPQESTVLTFTRSMAIVPRPFVVAQPGLRTPAQLADAISRGGVDMLVLPSPGLAHEVISRCGARELGTAQFREGTRNPFKQGAEYRIVAVWLDNPAECARELRSR